MRSSFCRLALTGCKPVGPNYNRPGYNAPSAYKETGASTVVPPPNPAGGAWQPANPSDGMLKGKWWEIYQDPQLNSLEERIDSNNVQLRQALETYLAARDQVSAARANLYPTLSAGPSISRDRISANRPLRRPAAPTVYSDFVIAGQASWEPDFWGRIRRTVEQARANAQASAADAANVGLTLHAEMATDYFALRGLDSQIKLLTATVADLERQLDLAQRRFAGGVATAVDVAQAQTQLETVRAQLVDLGVAARAVRARHRNHRQLRSVRLQHPALAARSRAAQSSAGRAVATARAPARHRHSRAPGRRGQRADRHRRQRLLSHHYPRRDRRLSKAPTPAHGFRGRVRCGAWARQAAELLFDAGQRHALTDAARHSYEAQADGYRNTVFQAFDDVEDQLSSLRILEQEAGVEQRAVDAAQHSFDLSNARYKGGVTSYLEVLTAEQTLLQNQRTAIDIETPAVCGQRRPGPRPRRRLGRNAVAEIIERLGGVVPHHGVRG